MPSYTLYYFPVRGAGEIIRQLFAISGTEYTDKRISHEEWPALKSSMPFGQMPVLEIDGKKLPQSAAIARYLAKQFGYAGKTDFEAAWVDALADQFKDYGVEMRPVFGVISGRVEGDKAKIVKDVAEPARDKFFAILEKQLKETGSGFLVGNSLTWVDLLLADHTDVISGLVPGFLDAYPKVLEHRKKVHSNDKIKAWLELRPKTPY